LYDAAPVILVQLISYFVLSELSSHVGLGAGGGQVMVMCGLIILSLLPQYPPESKCWVQLLLLGRAPDVETVGLVLQALVRVGVLEVISTVKHPWSVGLSHAQCVSSVTRH